MNEQPPTATKYQGLEGEDPTAPFWGSGNYVGPYWSNGKVQSSVEWGDKPALHELDELARQHDAAYAHFSDETHREAADEIFADGARKLKQKYGSKIADDPRYAAALVQYGNYAVRKAKKLPGYVSMGPLGILKYGYDHVKEMSARIKGTHLKNERLDVQRFFDTDTTGAQIRVGRLANVGSKEEHTTGTKGNVPGGKVENTPSKPTPGNKRIEVRPASLSNRETHNQDLIRSQHQRLKNNRALHDAAQASLKQPIRGYRKRKLNLDAAKPKKYWSKPNAVRPL